VSKTTGVMRFDRVYHHAVAESNGGRGNENLREELVPGLKPFFLQSAYAGVSSRLAATGGLVRSGYVDAGGKSGNIWVHSVSKGLAG
jgi:hypothetical protein